VIRFASVTAALACAAFAGEPTPQLPYQNPALPTEQRIDDLVSRMTLEEKVTFVHASGNFRAGSVPRLGVPYLWTDDGPQGVREETKMTSWEVAGRTDDFVTAMPIGMNLASTWDPELAVAYGKVVGEEAAWRGKHVILGPALNIQRTPLCGRTYDYFGEDPWLTSRMTVGYVQGMQGAGTIACLKHFALNNQETARSSVNVEVDERALREIYLPGFEAGVKEGGALAVMGAYNRFRGQYCCHNEYLLNTILKAEWGFKGSVISDWGGTHDTREAALFGLDLEMGHSAPYEKSYLGDAYLEGLKNGTYPLSTVDDKVRRNLRLLFATGEMDGKRPAGSVNTREHLKIARRVAAEGIVLLQNRDNLLPLDPAKVRSIAVIGENAVLEFAPGGNAAGVKAFHEVTALEGILARVGKITNVTYSLGYRQALIRFSRERDSAGVRKMQITEPTAEERAALEERAIAAAKQADIVIFVAGLTHQATGDDEGTDRVNLSLTVRQDELIAKIVAANPRTIVTLISGSPVTMPWLKDIPAVVQSWYAGSEGGHALAAVLFGDVNPSGKLPCTYPRALPDVPAHQSSPRTFPGGNGTVHYDEGLLVGYRWFDTKKVEPLFPFGFGLSYTTFAYANVTVTGDGSATAVVECDVTNTGKREGAEVVEIYVAPKAPTVERPEKELKGFTKVSLKPGETKRVKVPLNGRSFAYYDPAKKAWIAAAGQYGVLVGASSRDIRLSAEYALTQTTTVE
jgi:beta-glucosidase